MKKEEALEFGETVVLSVIWISVVFHRGGGGGLFSSFSGEAYAAICYLPAPLNRGDF